MATEDRDIIEMTPFGPLIQTADGSLTIRHAHLGQDFHSSEGALFEAWQLYIVASGLKEQLQHNRDRIYVLDVGMGLGYNACATIAAWFNSPGLCPLQLTSLEIDPKLIESLAGAEAPWCRGWSDAWLEGPRNLRIQGQDRWFAQIKHPSSQQELIWQIKIADATQVPIPDVADGYQYIWQDPFTPELNPGMWSAEWFTKVRQTAHTDAILMTYSVSRAVKDALAQAGWHHERFRTPGRKRHWLKARKINDAQ